MLPRRGEGPFVTVGSPRPGPPRAEEAAPRSLVRYLRGVASLTRPARFLLGGMFARAG